MTAKRSSIYMPEEVKTFLAAYGEENSLSGSIATIIKRYQEITRAAAPTMTEQEWSAICDILNGCGIWLSSGGPDPAAYVWAEVADSAPDGIDQKWGVSCQELSKKLRHLPLVGKIAVWDVAARFWASPKLNDTPTLQLLKECGAKIEDARP